ncbi:hypothetical protein [Colletotrichum camelliae filamentous virus 1]|uniref:Uncharacterized protein n=1 Tax=Colletotrichum camelliae filamentous virus 1 TaxID=2029458 RepID=A0A286M3N4_9VIRU|nr:hypothetical protein QK579_s6gp1 [Colletotrichum camelliae filamentous virus 1]ASV63098.1 hypothetical protein [Colletotrichum camelliae filamentous virus 1]
MSLAEYSVDPKVCAPEVVFTRIAIPAATPRVCATVFGIPLAQVEQDGVKTMRLEFRHRLTGPPLFQMLIPGYVAFSHVSLLRGEADEPEEAVSVAEITMWAVDDGALARILLERCGGSRSHTRSLWLDAVSGVRSDSFGFALLCAMRCRMADNRVLWSGDDDGLRFIRDGERRSLSLENKKIGCTSR